MKRLLITSKILLDILLYPVQKISLEIIFSIKTDLEKKGYSETKCKNYFVAFKQGKVMHKAVQSTFRDQSGNVFELQFQTPSSQAAKELKLPLYEERRKVGVTETRAKELESNMLNLANRVEDPKDIDLILSH